MRRVHGARWRAVRARLADLPADRLDGCRRGVPLGRRGDGKECGGIRCALWGSRPVRRCPAGPERRIAERLFDLDRFEPGIACPRLRVPRRERQPRRALGRFAHRDAGEPGQKRAHEAATSWR